MSLKKKSFYVINAKLQSQKEGQARIEAYEAIIESLTKIRRFVKIGKNEAVTIYPPFKREENNVVYYYGNIGKGVYFDSAEIRILKDTGIEFEANEGDRLIEPVTTDYIYVPSIHRFGLLRKNNSISLSDFHKFLSEEIPKVIDHEDKIEIVLERNPSVIQEIFAAKVVYEINYEISYTNNDALESQSDLLDQLLKRGNVGNLKVDAKTDHNEKGLNLDEVPFLGGGLELAKNNGKINSAKILTPNGKKIKRLSNNDTPKIETFELPEEYQNEHTIWFKKFITLHQNGDI
jgi:hypothetical protein